MPINRAPYNALIDDSGAGSDGTPFNKTQIKNVLLDPIDAIWQTDMLVNAMLQVTGKPQGVLAVGGDFYSHVMIAVGLNGNPLTESHQVGVYSAVKVNGFANGPGSFNAGFETACGTQPGTHTLERLHNYAIGSVTKGAGTTITRTIGYATYDERAGTHNAAVADYDTLFVGDWWLYYAGTRKSYLAGGDLILPREVYQKDATGYLRVAGGDAPAAGAFFLVFGQNHSSAANTIQLSGTAGITLNGGPITIASIASANFNFAAGDRYLVVDSSGRIHRSAIGPAS